MFVCASMSERAGISVDAWERWQVLALWAWPLGFAVGGFAGAALAIVIGALIVKWRSRGAVPVAAPVLVDQRE